MVGYTTNRICFNNRIYKQSRDILLANERLRLKLNTDHVSHVLTA